MIAAPGRAIVAQGTLRPAGRINAGRRLQVTAAHTHLSPVPPPFRQRGGMGGDEEGPLQGFKKSSDQKVRHLLHC